MPLTTCFRIAAHREALWKLPNLRAGRFHELGDPPTQYVALHPLTPWAEIVRSSRLPRSAIRREDFRLRLWALRIDLDALLALDFDNCPGYGISADQLVDDDQTLCRQLGQRLRSTAPGIVYPSSALPGTSCVCLFGERYESPYQDDPIDERDVPANVAAENGQPLESVLGLVRLQGEPHAALAAHLSGGAYTFTEPLPGPPPPAS